MDTAAPESAPSLLLELPDALLVAVLHCLAAAGDQRSLFSAARAHSRLHQAAVKALGSITAVISTIQRAYNLLLYLRKHGHHVGSVSLTGSHPCTYTLRGLSPGGMQLGSLRLHNLSLQLLPGDGLQGVLATAGRASSITQLQLKDCVLADSKEPLAAALAQLPRLQSRSVVGVSHKHTPVSFPVQVLQQLQQLSFLEVACVRLGPAGEQPPPPLTRLVDLWLAVEVPAGGPACRLAASVLAGAQRLTRLDASWGAVEQVEPAILAGRTQLRHLNLRFTLPGLHGAAELTLLLSQLQPLQQLTHLSLPDSLLAVDEATTPAAAFSSLTASSQLQHLDLSGCVLPAGVWQHIFPAGRQLPHLTALNVSCVKQPPWDIAAAPDGSLLAACCPNLQSLDMQYMMYSDESVAPLQQLTGLHRLLVAGWTHTCIQALCLLTGLRELRHPSFPASEHMRQLTQLTRLQRLTTLEICSTCLSSSQAPDDEPVWRQLLQCYQDRRQPFVWLE